VRTDEVHHERNKRLFCGCRAPETPMEIGRPLAWTIISAPVSATPVKFRKSRSVSLSGHIVISICLTCVGPCRGAGTLACGYKIWVNVNSIPSKQMIVEYVDRAGPTSRPLFVVCDPVAPWFRLAMNAPMNMPTTGPNREPTRHQPRLRARPSTPAFLRESTPRSHTAAHLFTYQP